MQSTIEMKVDFFIFLEGTKKMELNECRNFFLKTLGYNTDAVITELSRGIKRNALYGEIKYKRGGKNRD